MPSLREWLLSPEGQRRVAEGVGTPSFAGGNPLQYLLDAQQRAAQGDSAATKYLDSPYDPGFGPISGFAPALGALALPLAPIALGLGGAAEAAGAAGAGAGADVGAGLGALDAGAAADAAGIASTAGTAADAAIASSAPGLEAAGGGASLGSLASGGSTLGTLGKIAQIGAAGLGTLEGAQQYGKAGALEDFILQQAKAQQGDRNALRAKAMARLGEIPQRPDLGSLFAGSQNPFARKLGPLTQPVAA